MNKFDYMKDIFYQTVENQCYGHQKQKAYFHSLQVTSICQLLSFIYNIDLELISIIGLFHDYSKYIQHTSFDHASRSADLTKQILIDSHLFNNEEIDLIYTAIKNHSDKQHIHDLYSEIIKDSDVVAQYLEEPEIIFDLYSQQRLEKYKQFYNYEAKK